MYSVVGVLQYICRVASYIYRRGRVASIYRACSIYIWWAQHLYMVHAASICGACSIYMRCDCGVYQAVPDF